MAGPRKYVVFPATVGVDIGCGMMAVKTPFKSGILDGKLKDLRLAIEEAIPVGFNAYQEAVDESSYWDGWKDFSALHQGVHDRKAKAMKQLGTLGGDNHFMEVCLDTENSVWLMLHSGSRNIGKELAERHISTAKSLWRLSELPSPDLAYFIQGTPEFEAYWKDLKWAQTYAMKNRKDVGVLDEIPGAYKSIEAVMKNQEDLVEVVAEIKQVVCVKG